jgi:hypothetical protein
VPDPTPKKKSDTAENELKSLCRAFTKANVQTLGGYATGEQTDPDIKIRAIGMLFDRGYGKPKQDNTHELTGEVRVVLRQMLEDEDGDAS